MLRLGSDGINIIRVYPVSAAVFVLRQVTIRTLSVEARFDLGL
jgi:hypothetical protein